MKVKQTVPSSRALKAIRPAQKLPLVHPHSAGIDVGATEHSVCVPEDAVPAGESPVRQYRAFTGDLDQLVEDVYKRQVVNERCAIRAVEISACASVALSRRDWRHLVETPR